MSDTVYETDADIEKPEQDEEVVERGEVAIGSYKAHVETAKKGIFDYKIWSSLSHAVVAMAYPNAYHRIDLRDKDVLKRMSKDLDLPIDFDYIESQIMNKPFLIRSNGEREPIDRTKDESGKPLTKKALKALEKKEKIQKKIDVLEAKHKKLKDKKCPRALKLKEKIEELEKKKDRT